MTAVNFRPPQLTGGTEAEQLRQIQKYLYALWEQLQYAFDGVQTPAGSQNAAPAPAAPVTPQAVNAGLKALILKSAQVTQVLEQRVAQRLEGKYVAQSQFGTFRQETSQQLTANSRGLTQQFENVQQLTSAVAELDSGLRAVSATIRTGELADGVYGVEIGQQEGENGIIRFRRYARLTADRLSFYDSNQVEVAYISDRKLHVTAAQVAEISADAITAQTLQIADYTWQLSPDGHLSLR